jgi:hypothetical protein
VQAAAIALKPEQEAACTSPVKSVRRRITQRAPQASPAACSCLRGRRRRRQRARAPMCWCCIVLHWGLWGNAVQS